MAITTKKDQKAEVKETHESVGKEVMEDNTQESPFTSDPEVKQEQTEVVPVSAMKEMLREMQKEFDEKLERRLQEERALVKAKAEIKEDTDYAADILDDYIEEPVVFFSYHSDYSFHGDVRRGKECLPPQGKVKFKNLIRSKRRGEKGIQVISVSTAQIQSKAQLEFLRTSPFYGIIFHESINKALSVDAMWAQKLIEANQQVQRMTEANVISRCSQEGIPLSQDLQLMRKMLTEHLAKKSQAQFDSLQNGMRSAVKSMTAMTEDSDGVERVYIKGKVNA
jgi:hypothetical protein